MGLSIFPLDLRGEIREDRSVRHLYEEIERAALHGGDRLNKDVQ